MFAVVTVVVVKSSVFWDMTLCSQLKAAAFTLVCSSTYDLTLKGD
jgi:uncharacterized membrane protein